ncbi:MAG: DUF2007 domain-containing protein [Bacteroidota bacterium]
MEKEPHWELLTTVGAVFESDMIVEMLNRHGIPSMVKGPEVGIWGYGWGGTVPQGVSVFVASDRLEEAKRLLESFSGANETQ